MPSETIRARLPREVIRHLSEFMEVEGVDRSTAIRMVFEIGLSEWRKERALKLLEEGRVTFPKAADLAGVSIYELMELVRQRKVEWVHLSPEEMEGEFKLASEM